MEIKVNDNITIYCDLETSWMTGECYHVVKIYQNKVLMKEQHVLCCDDGYEAIFYVLHRLPESDHKQKMLEVVDNHYLCYGEC